MRVVIKEKPYDYDSDFPNGWVFSKGDYFKVVKINGNKCFVKRFAVKTPGDISGWGLMLDLRGKNEKNLARLYDIAETQENGKTMYYVFYEFIQGETLHALVSGNSEMNLATLTEDLFSAVYSLQKKDFWFADFTEKNIFCDEKGRFVLIDLDSTQPAALSPNNDMWGDKQYWVLVFNFYKEILHKKRLATSDINGVSLNYLSIIFLILRLKIYYSSSEKEYHSQELYDNLPTLLNNSSASFKLIFDKLFENNAHAPGEAEIAQTKDLVIENIIKPPWPPPVPEPIIDAFTISGHLKKDEDNYLVETRKPFSLHWDVRDTLHLELLRNNEFYKSLDIDAQNIALTESFNQEKEIKYTLVAYNNAADKKYRSLTIIPSSLPVINEFIINGYYEKNGNYYALEAGKNFSLSWSIDNASRIELYKNGKLYKKFSSDKNGVELTNNVGANEEEAEEYFLLALNGAASVKSDPLYITLADIPPVIGYFTVGNYTSKNNETFAVENSKIFLLKWNVKSASAINLYKDGVFFKQLDKNTESIELTEEAYDGKEIDIEYRLEARNNNKIVSSTVIVKVIHIPPSVYEFKADKDRVKSGKMFKLKWNVENATVVELYRNGELYETFSNGENSLQFTEEAYDNRQKTVTYSLVAINGALDSKSDPVTVIVKPNEPAPTKPILFALAGLLVILLGWKLVLPLLSGSDIPPKNSTTDSTNVNSPAESSLPPLLTEIWQSNSGKQLLNINTSKKLIYYSTGNNNYSEENIKSVYKVDTGTYKINVATNEGDKVFLIRNITPQSFTLSVCDSEQANCSDAENMHLYYKLDTSLVYLPVVNDTANDLQLSEKNKLDKLIRNSRDSFNVSVFSSTRFINASNVNGALDVLNSNSIHYTVAQQNANASDPFQRDYITIAPKARAPVSPKDGPPTYTANCNRVFYSISQTRRLASPLIVCRLDLSRVAIRTIPEEVFRFTNLRVLTLASNSIDNAEISRLRSALPACQIRYVSVQTPGDSDPGGSGSGERSLGYLQFNDYGELNDASKALLDRIVSHILKDSSAKIIFLSKWTGEDQDQLRIVTNHITVFMRYLQNAGIKSSNTQVASRILKDENGDVNKVNIRGTNFP